MSHSHDSTSSDGSAASSNSTSVVMMMMKPYLHFTTGDTLLFERVIPSSPGHIVAACIVVFALSMLQRYLRGYRRRMEYRFEARAKRLAEEYSSTNESDRESAKVALATGQSPLPDRRFILSHDLTRATFTGLDVTLHYLLMLIAMTFNAAYIISIILGAAIGDLFFGRWSV